MAGSHICSAKVRRNELMSITKLRPGGAEMATGRIWDSAGRGGGQIEAGMNGMDGAFRTGGWGMCG